MSKDPLDRERREEAKNSLSNAEREYDDNRLDEALRFYESARQAFHELKDEQSEALSLLGISRIFENRGDILKAMNYTKHAEELLTGVNDKALANDASVRYLDLKTKSGH
jgi:tetratricopeptide (TPR) repeat protein